MSDTVQCSTCGGSGRIGRTHADALTLILDAWPDHHKGQLASKIETAMNRCNIKKSQRDHARRLLNEFCRLIDSETNPTEAKP